MNIRDLKYLLAVANTKHFGQAAEQCFVSQPTLSMQIKKLEEELGVTIFERTNKQVMLTSIGKQIVEQAGKVLSEVEQLKSLAEHAQDPFKGDFKLGIIPTIGPYLLPIILPTLKKALPALNLIITENKTENIISRLVQGDLDAIILALPMEVPNMVEQLLYQEPFYLALSKHHHLAKKQKITMNDLQNSDLLLLEEGHCLRDQALDACRLVGVKEKQGYQATSLETLRHMVAANLGMTLLPELAIKYTAKNPNVKYIAFKRPTPSRDVGIVWRETSTRQACCELIADIIKKTI